MSNTGNSNRDNRVETIFGAVIGAVVQVILTILLTSTIQPNILTAIIIALPVAIVAFVGFRLIYNRWQKRKTPQPDPAPQLVPSNTQPVKITIDDDLLVVIEEMGISGATTILTKSRYEPLECMKQTRRKLYFMGILGSKWVEPQIRDEFKEFLQRAQDRGGLVRFLLINPNSKAYKQLKSRRGITAESLKQFRLLCHEFPCLLVRLYNQSPCFRLVFIDDQTLALSRYKTDKEGYFQSRFGWEAPHLVIKADAPWSMYEAFEIYFQQVWETAQEL